MAAADAGDGSAAAAVARLLREALEAEAPGHADAVLNGYRGSVRWLGAIKGQATADYASNAAVAVWKRAAAGVGASTEHPEAFDLAAAVLKRILSEDGACEQPLLAHAAVHAGGALHFCTAPWLQEQRALGRRLCRGCGFFFAEGGAMRQHAQGAGDSRCLDAAAAEYYEMPCRDGDYCTLPGEPSTPSVSTTAAAPEAAAVAAAPAASGPTAAEPSPAARPEVDPGIQAARDGRLEVLQSLAQGGSWQPLTSCDHRGNGPLHWAAGAGHLAVCRWLVEEAGLDPAKRTSKHAGRTALHWAARNGHAAVCSWLLGLVGPGHVDVETDGGDTPLMLAAWQGHLGVCRLLAGRGADAAHLNAWGCSAMHKAARMDGAASSLEVLHFLYDQGLDPCVANCNGHNALHKAAQHGAAPAARWLIEHAGCRSRRAVAADRDRNAPSALAYAAGFRSLASELRHEEDLLWLAPALYHPQRGMRAQEEATPPPTLGEEEKERRREAGQPCPPEEEHERSQQADRSREL